MGTVDTTTNISICNEALGLLAATPIVINTESANRTYCETFFARAYKEILAGHFWNFASKRAYALQTTSPLFGYDNAFTIPSDCIRIWKVDNSAEAGYRKVGTVIHTDRGDLPETYSDDSKDYLAGQYVSYSSVTYLVDTAFTSSDWTTDLASYLTSQSGNYRVLPVEYVYDVSDLSTWPDYVIQCMVYNMAIKLAPPIKQNEEAAVNFQKLLLDSRIGFLSLAKSSDAQESGGTQFMSNHFIDARTIGI